MHKGKRFKRLTDSDYSSRKITIKNANGEIIFGMDAFFPTSWSDQSCQVVASKYFARDNTGKFTESDLRQLLSRVSSTICEWGIDQGYFDSWEEGRDFGDEIFSIMERQIAWFNSPVQFNLGRVDDPQISACFINSVEDSMESIMDLAKTEALLFKHGSGTGTNLSPLRGSSEKLTCGGNASGPVSFMRGYDAFAGVIKSGGTHRRAAKMVILNVDHPDIEKFINCKSKEEKKAHALIDAGYDGSIDGEAYKTVCFQNSNNSVRVTDEFMKAVEDGTSYPIRSSKGSVMYQEDARKIFDMIAQSAYECGDPGIQFHDVINRYHTTPKQGEIVASNPCFTGDTMVAVADGRGMVDFKTLVEEGRDVLTYTLDSNGRIVVKPMINPRKTRENADVYRVKFDSGLVVKATGDHKFLRSDGSFVPVCEMSIGESIKSCIKHKMTTKEAFSLGGSNNRSDYLFWENNGVFKQDHRLISEHVNKGGIQEGCVVHHIDGDTENNNPSNLCVMSKEDHDQLHGDMKRGLNNPVFSFDDETKERWKKNLSESMSGEGNPKFKGMSNDEIVDEIKKVSRLTIGGLFCKTMWYRLGFPHLNNTDGTYRLNSVKEYCDLAGVKYIRSDKYLKLEKALSNIENLGLDYYFDHDRCDFFVKKTCEFTGDHFWVSYERRHVSFSSHSAMSSYNSKSIIRFKDGVIQEGYLGESKTVRRITKTLDLFKKYKDGIPVGIKKVDRDAESLIRQNNIFCPSVKYMRENLDRVNTYEDVILLAQEHLNKNGVDSRLKSSLIGESYNHKVVSVEYHGKEDVYDCTVEGTHVILVGGQKKKNKHDKDCWHFVVASQCGEFCYLNDTSCNLSSINLMKVNHIDNREEFEHVVRTMIIAQDIMVDKASYPTEKIGNMTKLTRPLGLGYCNLGGLLMSRCIPYDSDEGYSIAKDATKLMTYTAYETSADIADRLGCYHFYDKEDMHKVLKMHFPDKQPRENYRNAQVTVIAPTGTIGWAMGASSFGCEPVLMLLTRKDLVGGGSITYLAPEAEKCIRTFGEKTGQNLDDVIESIRETGVIPSHTPSVLVDVLKTSFGDSNGDHVLGFHSHMKMMHAIQPYISGAISKTVNMPHDATVEDIKSVYMDSWKMGLKSITVYRDGSKKTQPSGGVNRKINRREETRIKPAMDRHGVSHTASISGYKFTIMCSFFDDGSVSEIFIKSHKDGTLMAGIMDSFAIAISLGLQHGVPLETFAKKYKDVSFEPMGITDNHNIPLVSSVVDYVFRWLMSVNVNTVNEDAKVNIGDTMGQKTIQVCSSCGAIMVPSGSCYYCSQCGESSGCS